MVFNKTLVWILISFLGSAAFGLNPASLDFYREKMNSKEVMHQKALVRVQNLRKLLNTSNLTFASASDVNGPFLKFTIGTDIGSKETRSGIYKAYLMEAAEKLRKKELFDKPPTFNPSLFVEEVDLNLQNIRQQFCEEKLTSKFPTILNEWAGFLGRKKDDLSIPEDKLPQARQHEADRIALIDDYLNRFQPKAGEQNSLQAILGKLERVPFIDGHVAKLVFVKRDQAGQALMSMPLTFSMLATFRTGQDKYYLLIQECFIEHLKKKTLEAATSADEKKLISIVLPSAEETLKEAKAIHEVLTRLNKGQLNFLIDLFIQFRRTDLPVEDEMISDNPKDWNPAQVPSVLIYIASFDEKNRNNPATESDRQWMLSEYAFYRLMHQQLYDLETYLDIEKGFQQKKNEVLDEIRRGR